MKTRSVEIREDNPAMMKENVSARERLFEETAAFSLAG